MRLPQRKLSAAASSWRVPIPTLAPWPNRLSLLPVDVTSSLRSPAALGYIPFFGALFCSLRVSGTPSSFLFRCNPATSACPLPGSPLQDLLPDDKGTPPLICDYYDVTLADLGLPNRRGLTMMQAIRDNIVYASGYLKGRSFSLPTSFAELVSKATSFVSLPLPFLSFLALPFFSGTSTTVNLVFFYLTWSALVLSHDQLTIELYGTLATRLFCFVLPALGFLAFDCFAPSLSKGMKNRGARQLPLKLGRNKLLEVVGVALANVSLALALQAALELLVTEVFHLRSILRVTTTIPLPWNILKDVAKGLVVRGVLIYVVHRYVLHTYDSPLKSWHIQWQHSIPLPFSLAAAYDHPANYLLKEWLPTFIPAYLFRYHVLTWQLFVALCSLEELFVFSGYAVLPSSIVLAGMARRMDEHFAVVSEGNDVGGNFGRFGVLDFVCGTVCQGEGDAMDDVHDEAEKHAVPERAEGALNGAMAAIKGRGRPKGSRKQGKNG